MVAVSLRSQDLLCNLMLLFLSHKHFRKEKAFLGVLITAVGPENMSSKRSKDRSNESFSVPGIIVPSLSMCAVGWSKDRLNPADGKTWLIIR